MVVAVKVMVMMAGNRSDGGDVDSLNHAAAATVRTTATVLINDHDHTVGSNISSKQIQQQR